MVDYAYIQNYSKAGKLGISVNVYEQIVTEVTNRIAGASTSKKKDNSPFRVHKPVQCKVVNGKVEAKIEVVINHDNNVDQVCQSIQEQVAEALQEMCEMVPFSIKIKVAGIE